MGGDDDRLELREECERWVFGVRPTLRDEPQVRQIKVRESGGHGKLDRVDVDVPRSLHRHTLSVDVLDADVAAGAVVVVLHVRLVHQPQLHQWVHVEGWRRRESGHLLEDRHRN